MKRRSFLAAAAAGLFGAAPSRAAPATIHMMSPKEAIAREHGTRSARLRRLVAEFGITPEPAFYDYVIPARLMPAEFAYDTPVLRIVFPESSFFDTARSEILPAARPRIDAMAQMVDGDVPDVALFVAGHTDSRGSEDYNHNLSVRRAHSVASALRQAGASAPDIWSVGFGESLPLYPNDSPVHMAYNRRVEFLFGARIEAVANWLKDQMDVACSGSTADERVQCLSTLKTVRRTYVVEQVERPAKARGKIAVPSDPNVTVEPEHREIVINLAERSYVVKHPES